MSFINKNRKQYKQKLSSNIPYNQKQFNQIFLQKDSSTFEYRYLARNISIKETLAYLNLNPKQRRDMSGLLRLSETPNTVHIPTVNAYISGVCTEFYSKKAYKKMLLRLFKEADCLMISGCASLSNSKRSHKTRFSKLNKLSYVKLIKIVEDLIDSITNTDNTVTLNNIDNLTTICNRIKTLTKTQFNTEQINSLLNRCIYSCTSRNLKEYLLDMLAYFANTNLLVKPLDDNFNPLEPLPKYVYIVPDNEFYTDDQIIQDYCYLHFLNTLGADIIIIDMQGRLSPKPYFKEAVFNVYEYPKPTK